RQDRSFSPVAFFFFFGARIPGKTAPASTEGDTSHKNAARSHKPDGATSFPTSCEAHKSYHPEICDRVTPRPSSLLALLPSQSNLGRHRARLIGRRRPGVRSTAVPSSQWLTIAYGYRR